MTRTVRHEAALMLLAGSITGCAPAVPVAPAPGAQRTASASVDTVTSAIGPGSLVRVTFRSPRELAAVAVERVDTTRLRRTTTIVGKVAHANGDTLWVRLASARDDRGDARHWGQRRRALVVIAADADTRIERVAERWDPLDTLVVGTVFGTFALLLYALNGLD